MNCVIVSGSLRENPTFETRNGEAHGSLLIDTHDERARCGTETLQRSAWLRVDVPSELLDGVSHLSAGSMVAVEGRLCSRLHEQNGETKYFAEIAADRVDVLTSATGLDVREPIQVADSHSALEPIERSAN